MSLTWSDTSEIVAGLVMTGRISANAVRPELFISPYDALIRAIKEGNIEKEDLIEKIGLSPVQAVLHAAENLNGTSKANWVELLERSVALYQAGMKMEKASKKLQRGEDIDWGEILVLSRRAQEKMAQNLIPLSQIESGEVPFIPCGWKIIDDHLGGIPEVGLITVGGNPGVGKTSLMTRFAGSFAKTHPEKRVVVFSLEMILPEIAMRFREIEKWGKEIEDRILIDEIPCSPEEVISISASIENLGLVCIDFSDLMIKDDTTESAMAHIYRTLMLGAKQLHIPIILLSQLTRHSGGGLPKPNWLRYSGLAEALSWMILMLYDPARDWNNAEREEETNDALPLIDGMAYILAWKCRGGFRIHVDDSPGAICAPFKGRLGWHPTKSKWFSLKKEV